MKITRRVIDLTERVVGTFIGAFVAVYIAAFAAGDVDIAFLRDPDLFDKAKVAGVVATLSLVKGLTGFKVGDKSTASVIPKNRPEDQDGSVDLDPMSATSIPDPVKDIYEYREGM